MPRGRTPSVTAAQKRRHALELRKAGLTFAEIAAQVGYASASGAHQAVTQEIRAIPREPAEELKKMELERLDALQASLWQKVMEKPSSYAVDSILRVMERRARLLGLDAPIATRTEIVTVDAVDAEIQRLEAQIAERSARHSDRSPTGEALQAP